MATSSSVRTTRYSAPSARSRTAPVYSNLARLLKNRLVSAAGTEAGDGPERERYAITDSGVTDIDQWLSTPEDPREFGQSTLYTKVVLALMSHRDSQGPRRAACRPLVGDAARVQPSQTIQ